MRLLAGPVVLTSANRSGQPEATSGQEVVEALGSDVQFVLDEGRCRYGQPSSVVRVDSSGFTILRAGVVSENTIRTLSSLMVLFVCTGNTCRSPMAEVMCRKLVAERLGCAVDEVENHGVIIQSAGISAMTGGRPAPHGVEVMTELGLDLNHHETQPLTEQLVRHADIIFVMTRRHRESILSDWPEAAPRVRLLCRDGSDVPDPIGGHRELYQHCANQIMSHLVKHVAEFEI
jgi:protein-tyrosine phosphatase